MVTVNMSGIATTVVAAHNIAKTMKSGDLEVFATPAMCALMEEAAKCAVAPALAEGEGTVGTRLSITHDAPSGLGKTIEAKAVVTAVDGRKITFDVEAYEGDTCIGKGIHERFIINNDKFMSKVHR